MRHGTLVIAFITGLILDVTAASLVAQEMAGGGREMSPPTAITTVKVARVPVKTIKTEVPIAQAVRRDTPEFRGQGQFFQRCSVCHLGEWRKAGPIKSYAPELTGVLKDASRETVVRNYIRNGSANMPGFPNTFTPVQFDDLIAYLKTL